MDPDNVHQLTWCRITPLTNLWFLQEEIEQAKVELKHLEFREEVLKKQKQLLAKFANDVSTVHSMKVSVFGTKCNMDNSSFQDLVKKSVTRFKQQIRTCTYSDEKLSTNSSCFYLQRSQNPCTLRLLLTPVTNPLTNFWQFCCKRLKELPRIWLAVFATSVSLWPLQA